MLQYVIVLPVMMFILLVAFDLLRLSYNAIAAEFIVADTVRYAVLMKPAVAPAATRVEDIQNRAKNRAAQMGMTLVNDEIHICNTAYDPSHSSSRHAPTTSCASEDAGLSGQLVTIMLNHEVSLILPLAYGFKTKYLIRTAGMGRNEPTI